jgi:NAD-dependent DNA ligase
MRRLAAFALAAYFEGDYEAFRRAKREAFEAVNGVGENRATALVSVVR